MLGPDPIDPTSGSLFHALHARALGAFHAALDPTGPWSVSGAHRLGPSRHYHAYARRLQVASRLAGHAGCVNTVVWSRQGEYILSGSDDCNINLWDGDTGELRESIVSGHRANIFSAKFLSGTQHREIVSCAADGIVGYLRLDASGSAPRLQEFHCHGDMTYMVEPDAHSPFLFYSCSDDATVRRYDLRETQSCVARSTCPAHILIHYGQYCKPAGDGGRATMPPLLRRLLIFGSPAGVTCVTARPEAPHTLALATNDDQVTLWDVRRPTQPTYAWKPAFAGQPARARVMHKITDLRWDPEGSGELLASFAEADVLLLRPSAQTEVGSSDDVVQTFRGHANEKTMIKEANFFGTDSILSGSDDGRMYIWDRRTGHCLGAPTGCDSKIVNCVQPHPHLPIVLTSGIDNDIKWLTPEATSALPWSGLDPLRLNPPDADESEQVRDVRCALLRNLRTQPPYAEDIAVRDASDDSSSNAPSDSDDEAEYSSALGSDRLVSVSAHDVPALLMRILGVMDQTEESPSWSGNESDPEDGQG